MELNVPALWMSKIEARTEEPEIVVLLERAASGDMSAFEQILILHERRVLTLAWRLLGRMEDAQDAAQEVFLRTYKYLHRFDTRRPFRPWLVRMTVNVCRDLGRKRRQVRDQPLVDEHPTTTRDPHAEFSSEEQRQILYAALDQLPEKERAAIVLRDIEGFSTAEVADMLGSSEATVRSQISTARIKIRKAVGRL